MTPKAKMQGKHMLLVPHLQSIGDGGLPVGHPALSHSRVLFYFNKSKGIIKTSAFTITE